MSTVKARSPEQLANMDSPGNAGKDQPSPVKPGVVKQKNTSKSQNKNIKQPVLASDKDSGEEKSKAELKAARRALQETQRAAKQAAKEAGIATKNLHKASGNVQTPKAKSVEKQKPLVLGNEALTLGKEKNSVDQKSSGESKKPRLNSESSAVQPMRVAYNMQMDDVKVQKKLSKKLKKQQVPQRSLVQKKVHLFSHLYQYEKDVSLTKDVNLSSTSHPTILKLGLQYAEGTITGSNARCVALLYAFKKVIADYSTPPSKELSRDLEARIKPYISFLNQCRHLSVSMGNFIKFLKLQISQSTPGAPENEAKDGLLQGVDKFMKERIELAGVAISERAGTKIRDGDKIMIYGFSSLIIKILKDAFESNKTFHVIVVDSRPRFEGKECIRRLASMGIKCSYVLINAVSYVMKEVTSVFLGAHSLLANGYVMARAGTALVALVAKAHNVPVLVCCETYKFCERVQTDAFVFNELGDPDALVDLESVRGPNSTQLADWRDVKSLYLLNLMYDVTPANLVDLVITELGMIPCTSVPVVLRVKNTDVQ